MKTTPTLGLRVPESGDVADVPLSVENLATDVEVNLAGQGLDADKPTSSVGSPGKPGRRWYSTDQGIEYRDTGTGWTGIGARAPHARLAPSTPLDITSGGWVSVPMLATLSGTTDPWNIRTNGVPVAGLYLILADANILRQATDPAVRVTINGAVTVTVPGVQLSDIRRLNVGDKPGMEVMHMTSGVDYMGNPPLSIALLSS